MVVRHALSCVLGTPIVESTAMSVDVALLQELEESAYERFLLSDPSTLVYHSTYFRNFLAAAVQGTPLYLVAKQGEEIVGCLPVFRSRPDANEVVLNSLPWYGSHGGCALARDSNPRIRDALLDAYGDMVSKANVLTATCILTPFESRHFEHYRRRLEPAATDLRIGQVSTLPSSGPDLEHRLLSSFRQKTRNLVRKSLKQGFSLRTGQHEQDWRFLHATHADNISALGGKPKPWQHIACLREKLPPEMVRLYVALLDDRPVAALLALLYNQTAEYVIPAIVHDYRSRQPLSFLIWHAMLEAVEHGCRWWNWGGTWVGQRSLYHFKAGWAAEERPYMYLVTASPDAVKRMRPGPDRFPYYYVYPYHLISEAHVSRSA